MGQDRDEDEGISGSLAAVDVDVFDVAALLSGDAREGMGKELGHGSLPCADGAADDRVLGDAAKEGFEELGEPAELVRAVGEVCGDVVEVQRSVVFEDGG